MGGVKTGGRAKTGENAQRSRLKGSNGEMNVGFAGAKYAADPTSLAVLDERREFLGGSRGMEVKMRRDWSGNC